ncbi:hypothetical protein SteCoe_17695 [Stentor coeruleus]|uniref:Uncharacterized protein n=1 Tax=Stentor coeruleus TaxID=5963 RepID=A0A1R2BYQ2_9CILI|nr:hypothetical protein SteCoe_17695 [Stentor coeruleus]
MEKILNDISKFSSEDTINFLNAQLEKYFRYKHQKKAMIYNRSQTSISMTSAHKIRPGSRDLRDNNTRRMTQEINPIRLSFCKTPKGKTHSYEIDIALMIHNIFSKIGEQYTNTYLVQMNSEKTCNICLIKQFFLDCFVSDENLMNILLKPILNAGKASSETFFNCFEQIHIGSLKKTFNSKKLHRMKNNNFKIHKMLFFFSVVNFYIGEDLDRENLGKVLSMAERRSKIYLDNDVEDIMDRINEIHYSPVHKISFNDFYKVILSMDFS